MAAPVVYIWAANNMAGSVLDGKIAPTVTHCARSRGRRGCMGLRRLELRGYYRGQETPGPRRLQNSQSQHVVDKMTKKLKIPPFEPVSPVPQAGHLLWHPIPQHFSA